MIVRRAMALVPLVLAALWPAVALAQDNTLCAANTYALCSHALCTCRDADGQPTDCPTGKDGGGETVWSSCECPVVRQSKDALYNANIGNTACAARTPVAMPPFLVSPPGRDTQLIYSQYSLGDAVPNAEFGTLSGAKMQVCPPAGTGGTTAHFANCLDQPCFWDGSSDTAICYCPVNPAGSTWNTFVAGCDASICTTAAGKVWSAAPVDVTRSASDDLARFISGLGTKAPTVDYCAPG
ncbi:hypothetical protein [Acuticoccus kandeliae]|uniref:hypothetical protein n=1 Tax=Acuticoccus kandeliae TaxID=2073160 RepID=UPI000D3E8DEA|nr:hypothetical protein [Acuticoccus kandeliae]